MNINYINESVISAAVMRRNHTHMYSSTHVEATGERKWGVEGECLSFCEAKLIRIMEKKKRSF